MSRSNEQEKLIAAFVAAQAELKAVPKESTNPHFKSKYADLATIWESIRPTLQKHGLAVMQEPIDGPDASRVYLETTLFHVSGQWRSSVASIPIAKLDPQGYGSGLTYVRRYALAAHLGVVADDDDDGNVGSDRPPRGSAAEVGFDEFDALPVAEQRKVRDQATVLRDKIKAGENIAAYYVAQKFSQEEQLALSTQLMPSDRSTIKKQVSEWREAERVKGLKDMATKDLASQP